MSDEEYLKEYQKKYGTLTEEEKKEVLRLILIIRRFLCQMKSI